MTTLSMPPCAVCTITGMRQSGLAHAGEHAEAVEIGHHQIEHHRIDVAGVGAGQQRGGSVAAFGDDHLIAVARDHVFEEAALHRIVIDDENPLDHVRTCYLYRIGALCRSRIKGVLRLDAVLGGIALAAFLD